jgi:HK97 gp10 family phage protein
MSDFEFSELHEIERTIDASGPKVEALAKAVVRKMGFDTVAEAQALVPVDTGNLKNSIGVDFDADGLGFEAGPTANYGHFVEWGTSRMSPRPYMRPAFDKVTEPLDALIAQIEAKALE